MLADAEHKGFYDGARCFAQAHAILSTYRLSCGYTARTERVQIAMKVLVRRLVGRLFPNLGLRAHTKTTTCAEKALP
jgi:hypothetical protein